MRRIAVVMVLCSALAGCSEGKKRGVGEPCNGNAECEDELCHRGACSPVNPAGDGEACKVDAQCRSFNCQDGVCIAGAQAAGKACRNNEECLSRTCAAGACVGGGDPDGGLPDAAPDAALDAAPDAAPDATPDDLTLDLTPDTAVVDAAPKKQANDPCSSNTECLSGVCHKSLCAAATPLALGVACAGHGDCLSYVCTVGKCAAGTGAYNDACLNNEECAWNKCGAAGTCEAYCGNNIKEGTEACDGTAMSKLCSDFGKVDGMPECKKDCSGFLFGGCYTLGTQKTLSQPSYFDRLDVAFDGTYFLVIWREASGILAARVDQSGALKDTTPLNLGPGNAQPRVACGTDQCLVTWMGTANKVRARRVDTKAGAALGSGPFTIATPMEATTGGNSAALAFNGTNYLVTWPDIRNTHKDIYGAVVTPAGFVQDQGTNGFVIATLAGDQQFQWVASDGTDWLVTWYDGVSKAGYATWVKNTKLVLNPSGTKLPHPASKDPTPSSFRATRGQGKYLVTYVHTKGEIRGMHLTTSGTSVTVTGGADFPVLTSDPYAMQARPAWDGAHYIVTYYSYGKARLVRMAEDGTTWPKIDVGTGVHTSRSPAPAWGKTDFLLVWGYGVGTTYKVMSRLFR